MSTDHPSRPAAHRHPAIARRLVIALAIAVVAVGGFTAATARAACETDRCIDVDVPLPDGVTVPQNRVRILLPADYGASGRRYPVLYLLHGAGDTFETWTENTDVEEFSAQFPIIIVMPDGGRNENAGFYSDWVDGSRQWETFHTSVLRRYVDRNFRTLASRSHRALAGLSMGGFGAMSYAARHRDLFAAAASYSGAVDTRLSTGGFNIFFVGGIVSSGVWGDPVTNEVVWRAHNPTDLAARLRGTALFVATGNGEKGGPLPDIDAPSAYGAEKIIFQTNENFVQALEGAHVRATLDFYGGGYHGWPYWQRELHWSLPQILQIIGGSETCGSSLQPLGPTGPGTARVAGRLGCRGATLPIGRGRRLP
ncbi:MAG TPA: alpha/beta hydrolase family protein [Candidatus Binatia bacterium]|nr:alpha/beta hydrolase family protein [Candidatus Binatia bacterium]